MIASSPLTSLAGIARTLLAPLARAHAGLHGAARAPLARMGLAAVLLVGLAALGAGCGGGHSHDPYDDMAFTVTNFHGHEIYIEGIDWDGRPVDFGLVFPGETVVFIADDRWHGELFQAVCTFNGEIVDTNFVYDGESWDVF